MTRWFRYVALAEAVSFLLLLAATAVKYGLDRPGGVTLLGPIHGALFLAYLLLAVLVRPAQRWSLRESVLVVVAASVPFGGFWVDRRLLRLPAA